MNDLATPTEINAIANRVTALGPEARNGLLFALVGRMVVGMKESLLMEIAFAEQSEVGE